MANRNRHNWYLILSLMLITLSVFQISRSRSFQLFGHIVSRVTTDNKVVALTFDDGPAKNMDTILRILKRYNVRATFFLTGSEMSSNIALTKQVINAGHSIGNHSYSHQRMIFKSRHFIRTEVEQTDSIIRACGFTKQIYFRPPYCKKLFYLPYYLKTTNRTTVTWNVEPDSQPDADSSRIIESVQEGIQPGSIILLHAMYRDRQTTLAALPGIIDYLKENGYTFLTINDMMNTYCNK